MSSSIIIGYLWRLQWYNPHREPPAGRPLVLAEKFMPADDPTARTTPTDLAALAHPGDGYSICFRAIVSDRAGRAKNKEQLANIRRKRLARRTEAHYPLFADQIIAEEIADHTDYYDGITRRDLEAAREATLAEEASERERLLANAGRLIIHSEASKGS